MKLGSENLNRFFNPRAIAVIGASDREDSLGGRILHNLFGQYTGLVFPVNPFRRTVHGIAAFPSVENLPSKPDLAIVATPAHTIPQIVEECGKAAVKNIMIVSAGFDKTTTNGKDLIQQIVELKRAFELRIIGPNSFGIVRPKVNLYATFREKKAMPGKIAFISQSATLCESVLNWSSETQVGLSAVVSTGLSIDVDISDLVDYFGADPQTRTIMLYFEDLKNIRSFMSAARGLTRTKPIVLIKTRGGTKTGDVSSIDANNLVDEDAMFDAAFRRAGVVRVNTISELFGCGQALSMQPAPSENCLTIITNASEPGIMATAELEARGGTLWKPSGDTKNTLKKILPHYCRVTNPIDVSEASPRRVRKMLQVCLNDSAVRSFLVIFTSIGDTDLSKITGIIIELASQKRKTLLVTIMGEDASCQEARKSLNKNGIPAFKTPEEAVATFMYMHMYTRNLELLYQTPEEVQSSPHGLEHLKGTLRRSFCEGRQMLSLPESFRFLEAYKIPTSKLQVAQTVEQAEVLASEIGFPVRMQAIYAPSPSKSGKEDVPYEAGSSSEVRTAFNVILERTRNSIDMISFQGVAIQPKLRTEESGLFFGSRKDPKFGSIVFFGIKGAAKTHVKAVGVGFPPLNQVLARQVVDYLCENQDMRAWLKCHDFSKRGAIEETLVKLSQLVIDFPEVKEINVDPVLFEEKGIFAAGASIAIDRDRMMREAADHHEHLAVSPYPKKYITVRTLKNGLRVKLRPIKPEDEKRFNELFRSLSKESVRFRFFQIIRELTHDTLARYCNLDYDREIAIVAELEDGKKIIGVVTIIPDFAGKTGEFAIMVGDMWHGLGLGSKLMDVISDIAKDLKLERMSGYVDRTNTKMINMCTKKGFAIEPIDEDTIDMSKNLI
jgi:acetyltransferase